MREKGQEDKQCTIKEYTEN